MVQIIEPQRRRVGFAGRRKRLSRHSDDIYYTASTGHTILENNDEIILATPKTSSGSTVTPSTTKRRKKFSSRDETSDNNEVAALLNIQEENQSKKSDSSVQVSVDDDESKLNEVNDIDSSLPGIHTVTHNKYAMQQEERIVLLMKQLREKDEQINKLIISHSNEQESIRTDFEGKIESLQAKIVEMESKYSKEMSDLKVDVAHWKNKASNLSLDLERERRYKSSSHVYHGRFLLENPPPPSQKSVIPEFIHYSSSDSEVINGSQDFERNDGNVDTFDDNEPNGLNKQFFDSTTRSNAIAMLNSKPIVLPRVIHKANSYGRDTTGSTTNERHGLNNNYQLMIFSSTDEN